MQPREAINGKPPVNQIDFLLPPLARVYNVLSTPTFLGKSCLQCCGQFPKENPTKSFGDFQKNIVQFPFRYRKKWYNFTGGKSTGSTRSGYDVMLMIEIRIIFTACVFQGSVRTRLFYQMTSK
jgi:hypothetical protein